MILRCFMYFTFFFLVSDGLMEVYVSAMENPSQFWVQIVGPGTMALDKLVSEMTTYYDNEENYEIHRLKNVNTLIEQLNTLICNYKGRYLKNIFVLLFYLLR